MYDWYLNLIYRHLSPRSTVITYHRVADVKVDPHQLSVSPRHFLAHMRYLKSHYSVVPLSMVASRKHFRLHGKPLVAITFDDGYIDNLTHAVPILVKLNLPATIFVTVGQIGKGQPFYWDTSTPKIDRGRAMTRAELKKLAAEPNITIGSHTISHSCLVTLHPAEQKHEIGQSKLLLEQIINKPVTCLSYPFGSHDDINPDSARSAQEAGYTCACANWSGNFTLWDSRYLIPRYLIRDWSLSRFSRFIQKVI